MITWRVLSRATLRRGLVLRTTRNISQSRSTLNLLSLSLPTKSHSPVERLHVARHATSVSDATLPLTGRDVNMDDDLVALVRRIHASSTLAVFYVTGGGLQVSRRTCFPKSDSPLRRMQPDIVYILAHDKFAPVQALTWLLTVPGASNTVLETRVPYGGAKSMLEILGQEPQQFASTETAVDMANSAYKQAANLSAFGKPILGVSCTCALATDRVKKGDHKVLPNLS